LYQQSKRIGAIIYLQEQNRVSIRKGCNARERQQTDAFNLDRSDPCSQRHLLGSANDLFNGEWLIPLPAFVSQAVRIDWHAQKARQQLEADKQSIGFIRPGKRRRVHARLERKQDLKPGWGRSRKNAQP
jgi:hypothetical protein